jgi:hypothetical protein
VDREISIKAGVETGVVEATRKRIISMQEQCRRDQRIWEREYGYAETSSPALDTSFQLFTGLVHRQANIRLAKAYEGSHARLKRVLRQALRGEELVVSTIGGSGRSSLDTTI